MNAQQDEKNIAAAPNAASAPNANGAFVHLHLHTEFSLLDGAVKIKELIEACREYNMPAVAITDHGNMYGAYEFYSQIKKHNAKNAALPPLKAIIGCEFYVSRDMGQRQARDYNHLILLAKNNEGYKSLVKLNSLAFVDGFYYRPTIDFKTLERCANGLICMSACIGGEIPSLLLANRFDDAVETTLRYKNLFGDDFYIEIQDHGIEEQKVTNPQLVKIARDNGIKIAATNDVHYLRKESSEAHDVLLCVQTQAYVDEPARMRFPNSEFYLKTHAEMSALFPSEWQDAIATTLEIANKCNVTIEREQLLPKFTPDDNSSPEQFLRRLMIDGLKRRYGEITDEILKRAEFEFSVIKNMGFIEYYLIVWDFIRYARENGIPVGPGRGSGAGSIIAYAINITNIEPLSHGLLFERFLNPERVSMPDFDIDFCMDRRGEVIDYVINKYGAEHVAQIVTFGTMAAKGSFKDVARAMRVPYDEADRVAKLIPFTFRGTLADAVGKNQNGAKNSDEKVQPPPIPELEEIYKNDELMRRVIDFAIQLEGSPRQTSTHAAGVVICRNPISDHIPLQRNGADITTQYNMKEIEELGLLKVDFLGLRTLTDIDKTIKMVRKNSGKIIDFDNCAYDDPKIYKLISSGDTEAIFQLESPGMTRLMKDLQPQSLEDITAGISLFRPGPMDSIPKYVESRHNSQKITYLHPVLRPILERTYGCMVYQEQIMEIVRSVAGFSMAQSDIVRRAMSKKNRQEMLAQRQYFIYGKEGADAVPGALKLGVSKAAAEAVFDQMESFCAYAFNKSHAVCYAAIAYQTAYLRLYHPVEYIACVLSDRISSTDDIKKYTAMALAHGIKILPPDVNVSEAQFTTENGCIRFALSAIKGAGEGTVEKIVKERQANGAYESLENYLERVDTSALNKRLVENLIKAGALDCFSVSRRQMICTFEQMIDCIAEQKRIKESGQFSMFEMLGAPAAGAASASFERMSEYSSRQKYGFEKEVLGISISGSALEEFRPALEKFDFNSRIVAEITAGGEENSSAYEKLYSQKAVFAGGMLTNAAKVMTRAGKVMLTAALEDLYGTVNLLFFNRAYEQYKDFLADGAMLTVSGMLAFREKEAPKILVNTVRLWENTGEKSDGSDGANGEGGHSANDGVSQTIRRLYIKLPDNYRDFYQKTTEALGRYEGNCPCTVVVGEARQKLILPMFVRECHAVIYELEALLGENCAVFMDAKK